MSMRKSMIGACAAVLALTQLHALARVARSLGFGTAAAAGAGGSFSHPAGRAWPAAGERHAMKGAKVYADNCAACHGEKLQGQSTAGIGGDKLIGGRGTLASRRRSRRSRATGRTPRRCSTTSSARCRSPPRIAQRRASL